MTYDLVEDVLTVTRSLVPDRVEWFHDEVTRDKVEAFLRDWRSSDIADHDVRRDMTCSVWSAKDIALGTPVRNQSSAFAVKVALVVDDLRSGRADRVRPWEAARVAKVLGLDLPTYPQKPRTRR